MIAKQIIKRHSSLQKTSDMEHEQCSIEMEKEMKANNRTEAPKIKTTHLQDVATSQHDGGKSCFFAYLDILGFKSIVKRTSRKQLKALVDEFTVECAKAVDRSRCFWESGEKSSPRLCLGKDIHVRLVSDSIYIWTENDEQLKHFDDMLHIVRSLLVCGFERRLPLRGVVTYGEIFSGSTKVPDDIPVDFSFDNGSIYGKALVEAYETEGQMDWSGVVLTPRAWAKVEGEFERGTTSAAEMIMRSHNIKHAEDLFNHFPYFIWYDVPFKAGKRKAIAYNWNYKPDTPLPLSANLIGEAFTQHHRTLDEAAQKKMQETIRFYGYTQYIAELCDFGSKKSLPVPDPTYALSSLLDKSN